MILHENDHRRYVRNLSSCENKASAFTMFH